MPLRKSFCHGVILFVFIFISTAMLNTSLRNHATEHVEKISSLARQRFRHLKQTQTLLQTSTPMEQLRLEASNFLQRYPLGKPTADGTYDQMIGPLPHANHMECFSDNEPFNWLHRLVPIRLHISYWSTAEEVERRSLLRTLMQEWQSQLRGDIVNYHFLLGRAKDNAAHVSMLQENSTYGDIVLLDIEENLDRGKGWYQKEWEAATFIQVNSSLYDFFAKADSDAFIQVPYLALHLRSVPKDMTFYGKQATTSTEVGEFPFMLGMLYVLSADVVNAIANDADALAYWKAKGSNGHEDIAQGIYMYKHLSVHWISESCLFTDDPRRDSKKDEPIAWIRKRYVSPDIICIHRLKRPESWYAVVDYYMSKR